MQHNHQGREIIKQKSEKSLGCHFNNKHHSRHDTYWLVDLMFNLSLTCDQVYNCSGNSFSKARLYIYNFITLF